MATKPTDQDLAVLAYQDRMKPMARTMVKWADRAVTAMSKDIVAYLQGNGYIPDPAEASKWMVRPADSSAILRLTELARQLPEKDQRRVMASLMGDIGNGRLTRKKAIERMLQLNARALVQDLGRDVRRTLVSVADEASLRGVYMLQKEVGVGWNVDGINARRIQTMARKVYGDKAAWDSLSAVEKQVNQQTMQAIMLGESTDKLAHRIREVKQTNVWKSKRDARTKITEISNDAHMDAYEEHGVKRYQFMATYDERTCPICGRLDGKKFKIEDKKVGVNYPPMHPNCRCTTVAVMSKEIEELMAPRKLLVDKKTMTYKEIPRDYSYEDWYNEYGPGRLGKKFDAGTAEPKAETPKATYFENVPRSVSEKMTDEEVRKTWGEKVAGINGTKTTHTSKARASPEALYRTTRVSPDDISDPQQEAALTYEERSAIFDYTTTDYQMLNRSLWDEKWADKMAPDTLRFYLSKLPEMYRTMDRGLSKGVLAKPTVVFRCMDDSPFREPITEALVGRTFNFKSYTSASTAPIHSFGDITLHIAIPSGKGSGMYVGNISGYPGEQEFLIKRNSNFKVQRVEGNDVFIELVDDGEVEN